METLNWDDGGTYVRKIQGVFDEKRKLEEDEKDLREQLKKIKKAKKQLDKLEETLCIDLIKEKKIEIILIAKMDTLKEHRDLGDIIYEVNSDTGRDYYYVKGEKELSTDDRHHWSIFYMDYFYYSYPNYRDVNAEHSEMSEREMAQEDGSFQVSTI